MTRGATQSLPDALQSDFDLTMRFVRSKDFTEGVRAVLFHKDNKPKWNPATVEEAFKNRDHLLHEVYHPTPRRICWPPQ